MCGEPLKALSSECPPAAKTTYLMVALAVLVLVLSACLAINYRDQALLGFFNFRQTQTALTSYWACRGGFHAAYWTPVAGYPWSIPFEFPIYQWIVSAISCSLGMDLVPVGRLVSYIFWIACLAPAYKIARTLFTTRAPLYFWTFSALFLTTPLYLYWGRSFLIESAALFFAISFIAFSLEMTLGRDRWIDASMAGLFFGLAILQKSTTVLPLMIFAVPYLWRARNELCSRFIRSPMLWKGVVAYVVPFLIGVAWVKYSDHVKSANAFGSLLTSDAMTSFTFGTFNARYSKALWFDVIWKRVTFENFAGPLGAAVIIAGLLFARSRRLAILCGVALFLLFFMVFENLLFVHDYYPFSNTIYLVFALAVSIAGLIEAHPKFAGLAILSTIVVMAINLSFYFKGPLYQDERVHFGNDTPALAVTQFVREHTSPIDTLLIYGDDWSSVIPYYAQRKSFAVTIWFRPYITPLDTPKKYLGSEPGAILICDDARQDSVVENKMATIYHSWPVTKVGACDVFIRNANQ
jgi:hypothetical protein